MWNNPFPRQSFALCKADGTVLAELPPTLHFDSAVGRPDPPAPLTPRMSSGASGDIAGTVTTTVSETVTIDPYTWERAPFSPTWFALGDGLPREKPPEPSTSTVTTTTSGKTVTETVQKNVSVSGNQQTTTTTTTTQTALSSRTSRYVATAPYWGEGPPAPILQTDSIQAAFEAAYNHSLNKLVETWVLEQSGNGYNLLDKIEAPAPAQIVLSGRWIYHDDDEAIMHAAELEQACVSATQIMLRGRRLAGLKTGRPPLLSIKHGDHLLDATYTLTLYTTEYFTAQEFMRRQLQ